LEARGVVKDSAQGIYYQFGLCFDLRGPVTQQQGVNSACEPEPKTINRNVHDKTTTESESPSPHRHPAVSHLEC